MLTASSPDHPERQPPASGRSVLTRALARARWSILWERLWPALASIATAVPLFFVRVPSATEGLRRLDRTSRMPHRPATAIADELAGPGGDPYAQALWREHVERALTAARALKAGRPLPRLAAHDPYALRALVLIVAISAFFAAGGERYKRIAAAFDWHGVV